MSSAPQKHLLVLSGVCVDLIYRIEALPKAGGEARVNSCQLLPGGGFNALAAAKRGGLRVTYGGPMGRGPFAELVSRALDHIGVPSLQTAQDHEDQGSCVVLVDDEGERTMIAQEGADGHMTEEAVGRVDGAAFDWVLLSGYSFTYHRAKDAFLNWLETIDDRTNFVFDPAPVAAELSKGLVELILEKAQWISANREEAQALTGEANPCESLLILKSYMARQDGGVIVRDGAKGCWIAGAGQSLVKHIPAFTQPVYDSTGAGDVHLGSFLAALGQGKDLESAACYANASAALSLRFDGGSAGPEKGEVLEFLRHEDREI